MTKQTITLNSGEKKLWEAQPTPAILGAWLFTKILPFTFAATLLTFWCLASFGGIVAIAIGYEKTFDPFYFLPQTLTILAPLLALGMSIYCWCLRSTYTYIVTNQRILFVGGMLTKTRQSVQYHTVTNVEVCQNPIDQVFGIKTLKIFSPASRVVWGSWSERAEITYSGLIDAEGPERVINNILNVCGATAD